MRAEQIRVGGQILGDFALRGLELLLGLGELLRFGGDIRAHFARQIVEACEQDDDNQESENDG
jgi:hypothetical protein